MGFDIENARRETLGGIKYTLMEGYPTIHCDQDGTTAVEKYIIRSRDLAAFYLESMAPPVFFLNFIILPPRRRMPGTGYLITKTLDFEPHTGQQAGDPLNVDPEGDYDPEYTVTIEYSTLQESSDNERNENKPETFLEHSVTTGGEYLSIPANKTKTVAEDVQGQPNESVTVGGAPVEENNKDAQMPILKLIGTIEHSLKWRFVLDPNWEAIFTMMGTVNDREVTLFYEAKKETVLFMGISGQQKYIWDGAAARVQPWSLDFRFSQKYVNEEDAGGRVIGWNHFYSPRKGEWVKIKKADGKFPYAKKDHRQLFRRP